MILQEKKELPRNSLSENDESVIDYFTKREDIIITKADKGGTTVIMVVEKHISKSNQQFKDEKLYEKLNEDPARKDSDIINNTIESFKKQEPLSTSTTKDPIKSPFVCLPVCPSFHPSVNSAFF